MPEAWEGRSVPGTNPGELCISAAARLPEVDNPVMMRGKPACVPDSMLLVSFSHAMCVEHTEDLFRYLPEAWKWSWRVRAS